MGLPTLFCGGDSVPVTNQARPALQTGSTTLWSAIHLTKHTFAHEIAGQHLRIGKWHLQFFVFIVNTLVTVTTNDMIVMITSKENDPCIWAAINSLYPKIGGHILSTVFDTIPTVLTRRISSTIKSLSDGWSFPLSLMALMFDSSVIL